MVGAVNLNIVWILENENKINDDAPFKMGRLVEFESGRGMCDGIASLPTSTSARWTGFLATVANGGFKKKSVYFLPDCTPHELKGENRGREFRRSRKDSRLVK